MESEHPLGQIVEQAPTTQRWVRVRVDQGTLEEGDIVHIQGADHDLRCRVLGLRVDGQPTGFAAQGDDAEALVSDPFGAQAEIHLILRSHGKYVEEFQPDVERVGRIPPFMHGRDEA